MKNLVPILLILAFFFACHPEPDSQQLIDQLAVATNYDAATDFSKYKTYSIATDTIGLISNKTSDTIIVASKSQFPRPVITAVKSNLDSRGYQQVDRMDDPDLGINILVVNDFNVFQQVVYPNYYGGGYGYPGNYYSGYYGYNSFYSYPYINTYAYNTGVLIVEIVDLRNRSLDNKVKVVWDAYMGDVYSTLDLVQESVDAVNQAFSQSPYLYNQPQ
jgi:hypothetical protein